MKFILDYPEELRTALKIYAAKKELTMQEVVIKAIEKYIADEE